MPAGDEELAQLTVYLGLNLAAWTATATDTASDGILNQIEMAGVPAEIRKEGASIRCARGARCQQRSTS